MTEPLDIEALLEGLVLHTLIRNAQRSLFTSILLKSFEANPDAFDLEGVTHEPITIGAFA